jgi:PAS domain S-box-containing protein
VNPVVVFDAIGLLATIAAIGVLVLRRGPTLGRGPRLALLGLLALMALGNLSNCLRWSGTTTALEPVDDFLLVLEPVIWCFFIYAYLQDSAGQALRREKQFIEHALDSLADTFFVFDPSDGHALRWNRAFSEISGYSDDEIAHLPAPDSYYDAADLETAATAIAQVLDHGTATVEIALITKDGRRVPTEYRASLARDETGRPQHLISIGRDVSERLRADAALRLSEEAYRTLFEQSVDGILIIREGRIVRANQAFCEIMGRSLEAIVGQDPIGLLHRDDREAGRSRTRAVLDGTAFPEAHVYRSFRADGTPLWVEVRSQTIPWQGEPALQVIVRDVSQRQRAELALRESEERHRNILETMTECLLIANREGIILEANPAACDTYGYSRGEMIGMHASELIHPDSHPVFEEFRRQLINSGHFEGETVDRRRDGSTFNTEVRGAAITIEGEDAFLAVVRDVTERKRAEAERRRLEAQILHAQKLESLGVLAGGIAHDFNNLLTGIMGNTSLALRRLSPASPSRDSLLQIEVAAERAAELCRQMLAYSGKGRFVIENLDLSTVVQEMVHMLSISISKKATLRLELADDLPAVEADATQIRQILMNLITNASEAIGDATGVVAVTTGAVQCGRNELGPGLGDEDLAPGPYVFVEVADTGEGMDEETAGKIFDPFFTTKFTGRGLGLAAVLGIVRGHRGTIRVSSEPGRGSTFRVLLPAVPRPAAAAPPSDTEIGPWQGSGTILVADDEATVCAFAREILEGLGFQVLVATDGRQTVDLFRQHGAGIELVLLDMTMPELSGEEVFRELKKVRSDVCVILSSGYDERDATARFTGSGLAGFLQKPYRGDDLAAKVQAVLEAHGGDRPIS